MKHEKHYTFHLFRKVADAIPQQAISLGEVFNLVTGDALSERTLAIAQAARAGDPDTAGNLKKELPCIAVHGLFPEGRKAEKAAAHTGVLFIDIDDSVHPPHELVDRCRQLPYVLFAQVSAKQKGIHVLVNANVDLHTHHTLYPAVAATLSAALGERCDTACRDIARLKFLSHDPDAYYNPDADPIPVLFPDGSDRNGTMGESGALDAYLYKVAFPGKGGRHDAMVGLAANLNRCGFDEEEATAACVRRYAEADFGPEEITRIFRDIYAKYRLSHGSSRRLRNAPKSKKGTFRHDPAPVIFKNQTSEENDSDVIDIHMDSSCRPTIPEEAFRRLPSLVRRILTHSENAVQRDVDVIGALAFLGSVMPNVTGRFARSDQHTNLFFALIGEPASGKGRLSQLHAILKSYHRHVYEQSKLEVEEYRAKLEAYEEQKKKHYEKRRGEGRLIKPKEVLQRDLDISGNVSKAKLISQLCANKGYCTCLFDSEIENISTTGNTEYGDYMSILNQAFHGEPIQNNTMTRGSEKAENALLSVVISGTPKMFRKLIPSTENGSFSRFLMYRLSNEVPYIPVTDIDDKLEEETFYDELADEVLRAALFLAEHPTRVKMTDAQRKKLNFHFNKEHVSNIISGETSLNSSSNRMRIMIFRICLVLSALRKAEAGWTMDTIEIEDSDFEFAMAAAQTLLQHAYLIASSMENADAEPIYHLKGLVKYVFMSLPDEFKRSDFLPPASGIKCSERTFNKMLYNACKFGLLCSDGAGYYRKTDLGKALGNVKK